MATSIVCGDPYTRATRGFLNKDGTCGSPIQIAHRGYLIEITRVGDGFKPEFDIRPIQELGGVIDGKLPPLHRQIEIEEEEIFAILTIFLEYERKGLL